ncbi:MAG: FAD-binding oxidoreductase [Planctomycetota bacterium]|nr:FAD-binding oxidoreductase [Planctomycetota bacterium]MDA1114058.1 FAD-binding oxidoreductase [Planctomycetota bacterium]
MRPTSREELRSFLHKAQVAGKSVLPCGQGTRLERFLPQADPDVWLSCAELKKILWIDAEDQTCCVEAGLSLDALQKALASFHLQLDVLAPNASSGSLGGLFMSRERSLTEKYSGPTRDQVLGASWMMADGNTVQSGARVVKSVAGYDVTRLLLGSRGRLAICLDLTLRLRPLRPDTLWVVAPKDAFHGPEHGSMQLEFGLPHPELPGWCCFRLQHPQTHAKPASARDTVVCEQTLATYLQDVSLGKLDTRLPSDSPWLNEIAEACAPGAPHFGERR